MRASLIILCTLMPACQTEREVAEWEERMSRARTAVALTCPTTNAVSIAYDGEFTETKRFEQIPRPPAGNRLYCESWPQVIKHKAAVEREAIERCQEDAVDFSCPEPCVLLTGPGTCTLTHTDMVVLDHNDLPVDYCEVWFTATAEATDLGSCQRVDDNDEE